MGDGEIARPARPARRTCACAALAAGSEDARTAGRMCGGSEGDSVPERRRTECSAGGDVRYHSKPKGQGVSLAIVAPGRPCGTAIGSEASLNSDTPESLTAHTRKRTVDAARSIGSAAETRLVLCALAASRRSASAASSSTYSSAPRRRRTSISDALPPCVTAQRARSGERMSRRVSGRHGVRSAAVSASRRSVSAAAASHSRISMSYATMLRKRQRSALARRARAGCAQDAGPRGTATLSAIRVRQSRCWSVAWVAPVSECSRGHRPTQHRPAGHRRALLS
jgi:hypothetical protein